jgi:hypothetical protein
LFCDASTTAVRYDIQFKDKEVRTLFWEQLNELKKLLNSTMNLETNWVEHLDSNGMVISRIYWESKDWSLYKVKDWKKMYRFMQERLLEFDLFYQEYKEILINLIK